MVAARGTASVVTSAAKTAGRGAQKGRDTAVVAARGAASVVTSAAKTAGRGAQKGRDTAVVAARGAASVVTSAAKTAGRGAQKGRDTAAAAAAKVTAAAQTLLSSDLSEALNRLTDAALSGPATVYDKALDANYLDPVLRGGLGGSYHRLFDGGHTLVGAAKAVHLADTGETIVADATGTVTALLKDGATVRGLPVVTWDKARFDSVAAGLSDRFGIPTSWLYEVNTYNVADVAAATAGTAAVVFGWNRADTEAFAAIAASCGVSAAAATNPLGMMVAIVALARSFHKARCDGDYSGLVDGGFRGAASSVATIAAVGAVGAVGGSAGAALLVGVAAGVLAHKAAAGVSLTDVGRFIGDTAAAAAREANGDTESADARIRQARAANNGDDNDPEVSESYEAAGSAGTQPLTSSADS